MSLSVAFLLFPQVQQLDLTAPYEIFASLPGATVHLAAHELGAVRSATGLELTPTITLDQCPLVDVLCVPGGAGVNALLEDPQALAFVRRQAAAARMVTSVCTGALVLGAAGLLQGRRATTHWLALEFLPAFGAIPVRARVVRDGNLITAGGVTAGLDFALSVIADCLGREQAETIQLALEYAPEPPFDAGTPERAPAAVVAAVRQRMAATRDARARLIARQVRGVG